MGIACVNMFVNGGAVHAHRIESSIYPQNGAQSSQHHARQQSRGRGGSRSRHPVIVDPYPERDHDTRYRHESPYATYGREPTPRTPPLPPKKRRSRCVCAVRLVLCALCAVRLCKA